MAKVEIMRAVKNIFIDVETITHQHVCQKPIKKCFVYLWYSYTNIDPVMVQIRLPDVITLTLKSIKISNKIRRFKKKKKLTLHWTFRQSEKQWHPEISSVEQT